MLKFFKQHTLQLGIAAAMLGSLSAQAVTIESGKGSVLLFPVYTTELGWDSYLNIQSPHGFARIVFRDAESGTVVRSFNVYNSSVWRASLSQQAGGTTLRVAEGSCLVHEDGFVEGAGAEIQIGASVGMVEVYSEGDAESGNFVEWENIRSLSCSTISGRWGPGGSWSANAPSIGYPSTLTGEMILINVQRGLAAQYIPVGLNRFNAGLPHTAPSSAHPNLTDARPRLNSFDPPLWGDVTPAEGLELVADALRASSLTNDVTLLDSVDARTDWIISYPLQGYGYTKPYQVTLNGVQRYCDTFGLPAKAGRPSVTLVPAVQTGMLISSAGTDSQVSNASPEADVSLCNAVNFVAFGDKQSWLADEQSSLLNRIPADLLVGQSNRVKWTMAQPQPVVAFRLTTLVNGTLSGGSVLANYAVMQQHQTQKP
ncbi:hypothetical protein [Nitrincola alkalilacustris]|uniref:hypothetical protein n=1 Tax=Nitrincola alkalilacustris TaxID=1571224 RepID=UPI00124C91C8|nr:hypothetical protein [Nitrincola alkalilacustris]